MRHSVGEINSLEEIRHDPHIQKSYQKGAVKAEWTFSDGAVISAEGKIDQEALKEIPQQIEASVVLSCGEQKENYEFTFCVIPLQKNKKERLIADIKEQVAEAEPTQKTVALPGICRWKKDHMETKDTDKSGRNPDIRDSCRSDSCVYRAGAEA